MTELFRNTGAALDKGRAGAAEEWRKQQEAQRYRDMLQEAVEAVEAALNRRTEPRGITVELDLIGFDVEVTARRLGMRALLAGDRRGLAAVINHKGVIIGQDRFYLREPAALREGVADVLDRFVPDIVEQAARRL